MLDGERVIVKWIRADDLLSRLTGGIDRLGYLWDAGVLDHLPAEIDHATFARLRRIVARELEGLAGPDLERGLGELLTEALLEAGDPQGALVEFRGLLEVDPRFRDVAGRVSQLESGLDG